MSMKSDFSETFEGVTQLNELTDQDWQVLKEVAATTKSWGPTIAKRFYDQLYTFEPTAEILQSHERETREKSLLDWYESLVSGEPGESFWRDAWIVGLIHIRAGVPNFYMLGMVTSVKDAFAAQCRETFEPETALRVSTSFAKIMDTVGAIIAEGYTSGIVSGMERVGLSAPLMDRMRGVIVTRAIDSLRDGDAEP